MIPIFPDKNVGPAAYTHLNMKGFQKLLVSSIFYTIQGEGPHAGRPAVFVRLAGCNLGDKTVCPWCDSSFEYDKGAVFSASNLAARIRGHHDKTNLVVVTGGEPLLQWKALFEVMQEVEALNAKQYIWQFETNGVLLHAEMIAQSRVANLDVFFVVSPKVIGGKYQPLTSAMIAAYETFALKYIVSADPASLYHTLPQEAHAVQAWVPVYISGQTEYGPDDKLATPGHPISLFGLSPLGQAQTAANYAHAAKLALKYGMRTSFQTHLLAGVE